MNIFRLLAGFATGALFGLGVWTFQKNIQESANQPETASTSIPVFGAGLSRCSHSSGSDEQSISEIKNEIDKLEKRLQEYVRAAVPVEMKAGDKKKIEFGIPSDSTSQLEERVTSGYITLKLDAATDGFKSQSFGNEKHNITDDEAWLWEVTPLKQGNFFLEISGTVEVTPNLKASAQFSQSDTDLTVSHNLLRRPPYPHPPGLPPFLIPRYPFSQPDQQLTPQAQPDSQTTPQSFCITAFSSDITVQRDWKYSFTQFWEKNHASFLPYVIPAGIVGTALSASITNRRNPR